MPKSLLVRIVAIGSLALSLVLLGIVGWTLLRAPADEAGGLETTAGSPAIGGPFELTDQFGHRRTDKDFAGQYRLIYFGFTYCPDVCPTELQTMSAAIDALGPDGDKVTPIFITVDPQRDTVEQMRAYAAHFHPRLVALTGTPDQIAAAAKAYRVYYARADSGNGGTGPQDYTMDHSSLVYLMGPDGRFLTHFGLGTAPDAMAEAIRRYL